MNIRDKLNVFISGKEGELDAERTAALEAVRSLNQEPISSENRPASDNPIKEEFERELQESEIYVGIFGSVYSQPTVNEFDLARKNKIPVLVFVKKIPDSSRDEQLTEFLDGIKDSENGITISQYTGDFDLRDKITASLQTLINRTFRQAKKQARTSLFDLVDDKLLTEKPFSKPHMISVGVALDKIKYPVGAVVYVRAFVPFLISGEPLVFEVTNRDKIIFSQRIEPSDFVKYQVESGIYQTSFVLKPEFCSDGDTIQAKLHHGFAVSYDSAEIKHHHPVIQTDKTYYNSGTEMILTVIDPDADKDSDNPDYVGDKMNSKLIIESSKDRLENHRLHETGDSTGIFMDVLELVETNNGQDQSCLKEDQIAVSQNDTVKITYKNSVGMAELTVFVTG